MAFDTFKRIMKNPGPFDVGFNRPTILVAISFKIALGVSLLFAFNGFRAGKDFKTIQSGDTPGYLQPVENLLAHGVWAERLGEIDTYAKRPPAYGLIYLPLRMASSRRVAEFLLVGLQLLVSAIACVFFALTVRLLINTPWAAMAGLGFALLSFKSLMFDLRLLTESLTLSAVLVLNYLILKDRFRSVKTSWVLGFLMLFIVFMRPFLGVIFPAIGAALLFVDRRSFKDVFRHCWAIGLPFAIGCSLWSGFNYDRIGGKIMFLQYPLKDTYFQNYRPHLRYSQAIGGDAIFWNPDSTAGWFEGLPTADGHQFPDIVFEGMECGRETVLEARELISGGHLQIHKRLNTPDVIRANEMLNRCAEEFEQKHPFYSRFVAPLRIFWSYAKVVQLDSISNTNLYNRVMPFRYLLIAGSYLLNVLLLLGVFSFFIVRGRGGTGPSGPYAVMILSTLLHLGVICALVRQPEGRYSYATLWSIYPWGFWALHSLFSGRKRY